VPRWVGVFSPVEIPAGRTRADVDVIVITDINRAKQGNKTKSMTIRQVVRQTEKVFVLASLPAGILSDDRRVLRRSNLAL